ncbi:MAG: hypothetical protein SGCHY_002549 [Lobulomycetales sp.]
MMKRSSQILPAFGAPNMPGEANSLYEELKKRYSTDGQDKHAESSTPKETSPLSKPVEFVEEPEAQEEEAFVVGDIRNRWKQRENSVSGESPISKRGSSEIQKASESPAGKRLSATASSLGSQKGSEGDLVNRSQSVSVKGSDIASSSDSIEIVDAIPAIALANFQATDPCQISLVKGRQLFVLDEDVGNGWAFGETLEGDQGVFPGTYARILEDA